MDLDIYWGKYRSSALALLGCFVSGWDSHIKRTLEPSMASASRESAENAETDFGPTVWETLRDVTQSHCFAPLQIDRLVLVVVTPQDPNGHGSRGMFLAMPMPCEIPWNSMKFLTSISTKQSTWRTPCPSISSTQTPQLITKDVPVLPGVITSPSNGSNGSVM